MPDATKVKKSKYFLKRSVEEKTFPRYETIIQLGFPYTEGLGGENRPILIYTVADGTVEMLKCILKEPVKPDIYDVDDIKRNAFHHACKRGDMEKFLLLKENYPDALSYLADQRTANGITMLQLAIISGNVCLVEECLAAKCFPFAQDFYGRTCVDLAEQQKG